MNPGGGGGYSRVQEMEMIKQRQKSKHPKNPMQNFQTLTNWVVLYWKKKMRLGYIDTTMNLQILLNTAKLSHPEKYFPNFLTQKSPGIENLTSHKSLDLLCHLKSGVTPASSPPPPHVSEVSQIRTFPKVIPTCQMWVLKPLDLCFIPFNTVKSQFANVPWCSWNK